MRTAEGIKTREEALTKGDKEVIREEATLSIITMSTTTTTMVRETSTKEWVNSEDHMLLKEVEMMVTTRDLIKRDFLDQMVEELMREHLEVELDQFSKEDSTTIIRTKLEEDQDTKVEVDISRTGSTISKEANRERTTMEATSGLQAIMARDLVKTTKEARETNNTYRPPIRIRSEEAISSKREDCLLPTITEEVTSRDHLMLDNSNNRETSNIEVMVPDRLA